MPKTLGQAALNWEVSPDEWLPPSWKNARNVAVSYPTKGMSATGSYTPAAITIPYIKESDPGAQIKINKFASGTNQKTIAHEYAHGAWAQDLGYGDKGSWRDLDKLTRAKNSLYANAMIGHYQDPSEAFAEMFASYVSDPLAMMKQYPGIYEYFKSMSGVDYSQPYISEATQIAEMNGPRKR